MQLAEEQAHTKQMNDSTPSRTTRAMGKGKDKRSKGGKAGDGKGKGKGKGKKKAKAKRWGGIKCSVQVTSLTHYM